MNIITGVAFRFAKLIAEPSVKERLFNPDEIGDGSIAHLAGVFAAKEAVVKALGVSAGSWRSIHLTYLANGRPQAELLVPLKNPASCDLSIAHDGDYAIATFVALLR